MKLFIDFIIQNNDELIEEKSLVGTYKKNILSFKTTMDDIIITIKDNNIVMEKNNSDSLITFDFKKGKTTQTKYYIKQIDFYMDASVKTNVLKINDKNIYIEYELTLGQEKVGLFKYKVEMREL